MLALVPQDQTTDTGQIQVTASGSTSDVERIVRVLDHHQSRMFKATVISTLVVSIAALLNTWRLMKQLKRDERLMRQASR